MTPASNDYGADLIAEKFGKKIVIQAKCYTQNPIGPAAVQEVVTSKKYFDCQNAMVITNNEFTSNAKKLAEKNCVKLWDRTKLIKQLDDYPVPK